MVKKEKHKHQWDDGTFSGDVISRWSCSVKFKC